MEVCADGAPRGAVGGSRSVGRGGAGVGGWPRGWLAAEGREEPSVPEWFEGCRLPLLHAPIQQGLGCLMHFQFQVSRGFSLCVSCALLGTDFTKVIHGLPGA